MKAIIDNSKVSKNGCCVDYCEFTLKIKDPFSYSAFEYMREFLRLPSSLPFQTGYAQCGYKACRFYENIFIFYDPAKIEMGVHCRMTGQGCRSFEKLSAFKKWDDLFCAIVHFDETIDGVFSIGNSSISRLDIAYDDFEGLIDLKAIYDACFDPVHHVVSRWNYCFPLTSVDLHTGVTSYTINFGKKSSDKFLTFYDKLQERKSKDIMPDAEIWNRAELKLRNGAAFGFADLCSSGKSMIELYFLTLNNLLRIVDPSDSDSNRWRWGMQEHWKRFANSLFDGRICLYSPPCAVYNEDKLENYVVGTSGAAIYTYLKVFSIYDLLQKVQDKVSDPEYHLNPKYIELLNAAKEVDNNEPFQCADIQTSSL